jgi:hypothetical protein
MFGVTIETEEFAFCDLFDEIVPRTVRAVSQVDLKGSGSGVHVMEA